MGIEPTMEVLQTSALPLGYVALELRSGVFEPFPRLLTPCLTPSSLLRSGNRTPLR